MGRNRIKEVDDQFTVTDNEIRSRLLNILHQIITDKDNLDNLNLTRVQLISNDDQTFTIEKVYLLENCPVLDLDLIDSTSSEEVHLETCNGEVLEQILNFIRTGETNLNLNNLAMISKTCDKLGLDYLKNKCSELRKNITTKRNWTDMLKIAIEVNDKEFQDIIFGFLKKNHPNFYEDEQYRSLNYNEVKSMVLWPKRLFEDKEKANFVICNWCNFDQKHKNFNACCHLISIANEEYEPKAKETASLETDKTSPEPGPAPLRKRISINDITNTPPKGIKRERDSEADVGQENDDDQIEVKSEKGSRNPNKTAKLQKIEISRPRTRTNEPPLFSSQIIFSFKDQSKKGSDIISLDIDTRLCRIFKSNLPKSMYGSKVIIGDDRVYKIGGFHSKINGESSEIKSFPISQFLKPTNYNPRIEWRVDGHLSCERTNFECIIAHQNLYIICGNTDCGKCASPEIEKFDLNQKKTLDVLSSADDGEVIDEAKFILKYYRENFGVALLDDKIYIVGGRGAQVNDDEDDATMLNRQVLDSVEFFDVQTEISEVLPNMSTKRVDHMVVAAYGNIYVLGGRSENSSTSSALKTVEIYHPECRQWTQGKSMNTKRAGGSAFFYEGCIWVAGGNKDILTIEKFDPKGGPNNSGEWTIVKCKLPYSHQKVDMCTTCVLIKDNTFNN